VANQTNREDDITSTGLPLWTIILLALIPVLLFLIALILWLCWPRQCDWFNGENGHTTVIDRLTQQKRTIYYKTTANDVEMMTTGVTISQFPIEIKRTTIASVHAVNAPTPIYLRPNTIYALDICNRTANAQLQLDFGPTYQVEAAVQMGSMKTATVVYDGLLIFKTPKSTVPFVYLRDSINKQVLFQFSISSTATQMGGGPFTLVVDEKRATRQGSGAVQYKIH
jgi:hypothetical protein